MKGNCLTRRLSGLMAIRGLILALVLVIGGGCEETRTGGQILPALGVTFVGPQALVPGSRLVVRGTGFVLPEAAELTVQLDGLLAGVPFAVSAPADRIDDETVVVTIVGDLQQVLIPPGADLSRLAGRLTVTRRARDANGNLGEAESQGRDFDLTVSQTITPELVSVAPEQLYVGELVTLTGSRFLFPSEGVTLVELSGQIVTAAPARLIAVQGLQVPAIPSGDERDAIDFVLTPDVLGIIPGRFTGTMRVINSSRVGITTVSEPVAVDLPLAPPRIDEVTPLAASRGQWIRVRGRGFLAADGLLQAAMVLVLDGTFRPAIGGQIALTGPRALTLVPDIQLDNQLVSTVLRVGRDGSGQLTGLGLIAGTFEGTISPWLFLGPDLVKGEALSFTFQVLPQKQVVYLRELPGFDDALVEFGLLAEKAAVKARILEVCVRDYQGVHIEFTWDEPTEYAEYGVVEIAGRDPNGTGLFGLDNTSGKDVGNLRFNDIIGGYNADTQAEGYSAYGGIFPAEFMNLSARLGDNPLSSQRFDDVFGPVAPALDGKPAERGELDAGGARAADIREAVRVYGNLVGSTVSHEIGHSLGLANVDGQFHNAGDNPGWIMDSGTFRTFEERGEVDGQGPSFFEPESMNYLRGILPLPVQ